MHMSPGLWTQRSDLLYPKNKILPILTLALCPLVSRYRNDILSMTCNIVGDFNVSSVFTIADDFTTVELRMTLLMITVNYPITASKISANKTLPEPNNTQKKTPARAY